MLRIWKAIATLGPIGYYKGSGTLASAISIVLVIFLHSLNLSQLNSSIVLVFLTILALKLVATVMPFFSYQDSPHIVIDEVLGMVYTFWGINLSFKVVLWGFVFFRFFDITKILGIGYLEKNIPNPSAIVIDDIVAGLFANCLLRFFTYL
jgi:phosphatidylglycerophosphatase A